MHPGLSIAYDPAEFHWARNRPARHRTPLPKPGDEVLYRHFERGIPTRATVLEVMDPDPTDLNVWRYAVNALNDPVVDGAGRRLMEYVADPWHTLLLRTDYGVLRAREARLRESPGWLPLDWRTRWRPNETGEVTT